MSNINPRVDIAFKKIFGVEGNEDLLISLINSIVTKEDRVKEVTVLNPYNPENFKGDKMSILDIKATNEAGKRYDIEMQIRDESHYDKRALYYWSKLYTQQLTAGESYSKLNKVIGIHILNFTSIDETDQYHNRFIIKEADSNFAYFNNFELHTIELNKFKTKKIKNQDLIAKVKTSLDAWALFLTKHNILNKDKLPSTLEEKEIRKAIHVLEVMNFTSEERMNYEEHEKWLLMEADALQKRFEDGEKLGIEKGKAEGKLEGKIEIAKSMLLDGALIDTIVKYSGLSKEEVIRLQNS